MCQGGRGESFKSSASLLPYPSLMHPPPHTPLQEVSFLQKRDMENFILFTDLNDPNFKPEENGGVDYEAGLERGREGGREEGRGGLKRSGVLLQESATIRF